MQHSHHTSLSTTLSQINNKPPWYTVKLFRHQLLKFLVEEADYILEELDEHLKKSTRSYQDICMHLAKVQKSGDAIHFIVSAINLMLNIPLLMVYSVQTVDKHTGCITYEYKEMALCTALSRKIWSQYPIKLMYNGIDHYFAFINDKIGLIANLGNPVVIGLNELCEDFETLINEVPDNTTLKAGLIEMIQHMKAAQKIGAKLTFTNGIYQQTCNRTTRGARHFAHKEY